MLIAYKCTGYGNISKQITARFSPRINRGSKIHVWVCLILSLMYFTAYIIACWSALFLLLDIRHYRTQISNRVATSHMWLLRFKLMKIKYDLKFSSSVVLPTFQILNSLKLLVTTILDSTDYITFPSSHKIHWMHYFGSGNRP